VNLWRPFWFLAGCILFLLAVTVAYADCCKVYDVNALVIAPNGATHLYTNCTYVSSTGTCGTTSSTTVTYECNLDHSFCPVEGKYDVNFILSVAASPDCTAKRIEYNVFTNFYDVNYDASEQWCTCKLGPGHWDLGGNVAANSCCGDDSGEYVRTCQGASAVCNASTDNTACCNSSSDCVFNNQCYPSGTGMVSVGGGTYVCSNGSWSNCIPPPSSDWNIVSACTVSSAINVAANIWIKAGGILHVLSGGSVSVGGGYIFVLPGGEIQVESGGEIS